MHLISLHFFPPNTWKTLSNHSNLSILKYTENTNRLYLPSCNKATALPLTSVLTPSLHSPRGAFWMLMLVRATNCLVGGRKGDCTVQMVTFSVQSKLFTLNTYEQKYIIHFQNHLRPTEEGAVPHFSKETEEL